MAAQVQNNLLLLHSSVASDNLGTSNEAEKATNTIRDISKISIEDVQQKDLEYVCSLLFNEEKGVISFLKKVIQSDEFKDSRCECLEFLAAFMEKATFQIQTYAVYIKEACFSFFVRDRFSKGKSTALKVVTKVLELYQGNRADHELKVPDIVDKLFLELARPSKLTPTVKCALYELMGVLAQHFPQHVERYSGKIRGIFLSELKQQMTSRTKSPDFTIIAGSLHGLCGFLHSFTQSAEEEPVISKEIFNYVVKAIDCTDVKRYDMLRGGLRLLSRHSQQFGPYLYDQHATIYQKLRYWSRHRNPDVQKLALAALEAFLEQIAEMIVVHADEKKGRAAAIFTFFIKEFHLILDTTTNSYEMSVAIKGYGVFAVPCKHFLSTEDVHFMFNEMLQRSEQIYLSNSEMLEDKVQNLPSFLESLSSILRVLDQINESFVLSLERLVVLLMENYPQINPKRQFLCHRALLTILLALYSKGSAFQTFLNKIVYQGLLRTCSHPIEIEGFAGQAIDSNLPLLEADPRKITYSRYMAMWKALLDAVQMKELNHFNIPLADRETVTRAIYDEVIKSVLEVVKKLDLGSYNQETSTQLDTQVMAEGPSADSPPEEQMSNPKDIQILHNLVCFCRDLLLVKHCSLFENWVLNFGQDLTLLATNYPFVSGLYKLIAVGLEICGKIKFFKMEADEAKLPNQERKTSFFLFSKFVKEILARTHQFKDDLLVSCLQVLLALPKEIVIVRLPSLVPAMQTAFKLGLSYLPLAVTALDALEMWCARLPPDALKPFFPKILPCLGDYLKSAADIEFDAKGVTTNVSIKEGKSTRGKNIIAVKQPLQRNEVVQNMSSLSQVRHRIILLLGSLGSKTNSCMVRDSPEEIAKMAVAWDTQRHLLFAMPFVDMKPVLELDSFLPRIVELAGTSGDRQTKVAACELLHALVLFMLGSGAQRPDSQQKKYPMDKLYKHVFPALLKLACDVEQVARQLFEPLVLQLIHWFTNNRKIDNVETAMLLEALLDGVVHPTDTSLRDFSSRCIKEFLLWSIKQSTPKQQETNPINTKVLLKRMCSLSLHPNAFQRLGAAMVFNNIYTVFREDPALVNMFILEILVNFVDSLAIAHHDEKSMGTQAQCKKALDHIERILRAAASQLNKPHKNRRQPQVLDGPTLLAAVDWLLVQCGRPQTECRHKCMELVCNLSPCLPGVSSSAGYFRAVLQKKGPVFFITKFEGGYIDGKNKLDHFPSSATVLNVCSWMEHLLAALDCYTWVLGERLLSPDDIFTGDGSVCIFAAISWFLTNLALVEITQLAAGSSSKEVYTPKETEDYNRTKCTTLIRVLYFVSASLTRYPKETQKKFPPMFWTAELWNVILSCVLKPACVGFNMVDIEVMQKLPQELELLLTLLKSHLTKSQLEDLSRCISKHLTSPPHSSILSTAFSLSDGEAILELTQFVAGLELLHKSGFHLPDLIKSAKKVMQRVDLATHFLNLVFKSCVGKQDSRTVATTLTPSLLELENRLLAMSFLLEVADDDVIRCISDSSVVLSSSGKDLTSAGSHFFTTFRTTLSVHLAKRAPTCVSALIESRANEQIVTTIINVLEQVGRNREWRKQYGSSILLTILGCWPKLSHWWDEITSAERQNLALILLSKMLVIDSKVVCDVNQPAFTMMFDMYLKMLVDPSATLMFKGRVLDLLPFFTTIGDDHLLQLKNHLIEMATLNFPLKSSEYAIGSPKYNEYISVFSKILSALEYSGSLMLLEFIISIVCRESHHVQEEQVQKSLIFFIRKLSPDKHQAALEVPFNTFMAEGSGYTVDIQRAALERVCLTLLRNISLMSVTNFFVKHVVAITEIIQTKPVKGSEDRQKSQLVAKLGCFMLIELLFSRLTKADLNTKESQVNQSFCKGCAQTGKELTQEITRAAHSAKKENVLGETTLLELRRQYHCAAFNTLISVISCTQTEAKFFSGFLFSENPVKGDFLWDNLVDRSRVYEFDIELESVVRRKKQFVSIRQDVKQKRLLDSDETDAEDGQRESIHYLTSQYLAESSLSEEVSQFDFSTSAQAFTQSLNKDALPVHKKRRTDVFTSSSLASGEDYIELEIDAWNEHECMGSLSSLLHHMVALKLTPLPDATEQTSATVTEMPSWMANVHKKMADISTNHNVKLFIAKLIINNEQIFQPFAKFWLNPLTQLIVSGSAGSNINFFITDVIVVLMSWAPAAIPEDTMMDRSLSSRLLEFLMSNVGHPRRDIMRNNLEIVKTVLECWKSRLDIPTKMIYDQLKNPDPTKLDNSIGIQLLAIVLANGLPPYMYTSSVDKDKFFEVLAINITFKYKEVYAASAEVVGMVLKYMNDKENVKEGPFHELVARHIEQLSKTRKDVFINVVHKIQQYYPSAMNRFINKILFLLPNVYGIFRTLCLEIVKGQVNNIENIFVELKTKNFLTLLTHRYDGTQIVALQIVHALLPTLKVEEVLYFLPTVMALSAHPNVMCRKILYDVLMWLYDAYRNKTDDGSCKVTNQAKEGLLQGLADSDLGLRLTVNNFWSDAAHLPTSTLERAVTLMQNLYSPSIEQHFLSYATFLLLERTSQSPDYQRKMFEHPLSDCRFADYSVNSAWNQRYSIMTPFYAESLSSLTSDGSLSSVGESLSGQVRATQEVMQFTATQDQAGHGAFNWLTQSKVDTLASSGSLDTFTANPSSLLFSIGKTGPSTHQASKRQPAVRVGTNFGPGHASTSAADHEDAAEEISYSQELRRLKKRFLKDTDATSKYFATMNLKKQKRREEQQSLQKKRREAQVTLYRKYRIGDLPDIEINYSAVIAPLQALAQRDDTIAKLLFTLLLKGIFAEMEKIKSDEEAQNIYTDVTAHFCRIMRESTQYSPSLIASVLEVSYHHCTKLKLELDDITTACIASMQQSLGILLIEEYLRHREAIHSTPSSAKRRRTLQPLSSEETKNWLKLAELYKTIDNYDIVRGIFSSRFGSRELSQLALEEEMRGDYGAATSSYRKALDCTDWPDAEPEESEMEFWDDSYMKCLNFLGKWDRLETHVVDSIAAKCSTDNLMAIWEDGFSQEHYLPYLIRSKLKQLVARRNDQSLLTFVDNVFVNIDFPNQKEVLENRYSEELALLYILQEDYDRAHHYSSLYLEGFLQDWASMAELTAIHRRSRLQDLQKLSEMHSFLDIIKRKDKSSYQAKALVHHWQSHLPDPLDPMTVWDDIIANRCLYLEQLEAKLESEIEGGSDADSTPKYIFLKEKCEMKLAYAAGAVEQGVSLVAQQQLKSVLSHIKRLGAQDVSRVQWCHSYTRTHHKYSPNLSGPEIMKRMLAAWSQLDEYTSSSHLKKDKQLAITHHTLYSRTADIITRIVNSDTQILSTLDRTSRETLSKLIGMKPLDSDKVVAHLLDFGYKQLLQASEVVPKQSRKQDEASVDPSLSLNPAASAFLNLAIFCDEHLRNAEDDDNAIKPPSLAQYPSKFVESLLEAMALGDRQARQLFPRLLQIVELHPETMDLFQTKAADVPSWMFIAWISQVVALLDKPEAPAVQKIVLSLVEDYPQALIYPFKLSCDGFKFGSGSEGKENRMIVKRIQSKLAEVPLVDDFIRALDQLSQVEALFQDACKEIAKLLRNVTANKAQILDFYATMIKELFVPNEYWGKYRRQFAKEFLPTIEGKFGKDGAKLLKMKPKEFQAMFKVIVNDVAKTRPTRMLKDYSEWLSKFHAIHVNGVLEIPGQYTGQQKPIPEYHVKIASFDQSVLLLASIRKPKRITIRGHDEREYRFLVKGGEDLRLDQRIEQLFAIMNEIYAKDAVCGSRRLNLATYQVIPLTPRIGLLEWVDHTATLKDFLSKAMTEEELVLHNHDPNGVQKTYTKWVEKTHGDVADAGSMFQSVLKKKNRSEVTSHFNFLVSKVPKDLLRRAFLTMSSCVEAFLTLRSYFATSHALVCISQYFLGIGDRHLSNFMISLDTGRVVGIDFGHAFGSATQFLPVPEMAPFRLTPQLLALMEPFREAGTLKATMIHAATALRNNTHLLLNTMDIFIKEPSLDWQDFAQRQQDVGTGVAGETDTKWYPKQKIGFARRKLLGYNPVAITREELRLGHLRNPAIKEYISVIEGDKAFNVRARMPSSGLTSEQQVECLIDQATDANILGRAYWGWEAWM